MRSPKDADGMANSVDPDQTAQSDLGLHCLPRPVCPKTKDHFCTDFLSNINKHKANTLLFLCVLIFIITHSGIV